MKLDDIGFYSLLNERAKNCSDKSPLWRCELILTGLCNFKCPYCRGSRTDEEMPKEKAFYVLDKWIKEGLKNVRFSGGEPTLYPYLLELVKHCKQKNVGRIAISTNGSADIKLYKELVFAGVSDFSISLDACCSSFGDKMAGVNGAWENVVNNIKILSKLTYVTVGCVFTKETVSELANTINFASNLGVSDIRIISSAQEDITPNVEISNEILKKHPILNYRIKNFNKNKNVRGIKETDCHKCYLALDDMAVEGEHHYPCIIHLREGKQPIGKIEENIRQDRKNWVNEHNSFKDEICRKNCLDVCVEYNNKAQQLKKFKD